MNFVSFLCSGKCINGCKMTADIAVSDFGKKIYYSKEAIDVPRPMAESIKEIIMGSSFIAPLKNAMNELLTPKTKKNGNDYNQ